MSSSEVQIHLRKRVVVFPDASVYHLPFSAYGLRKLNSLNTDVQIEGIYVILISDQRLVLTEVEDQSLPGPQHNRIRTGPLRLFVDNSDETEGKILRVVHAPSDVVHHFPFTTEYLAWRETRSLAYCKEEDDFPMRLLRWNDFSNTDAMQWWRMVPHGFGMYFDVHEGSQWIAIAAPRPPTIDPNCSPFDPDLLATPEIFLPDFVPTEPLNRELIHPEAMLLTVGTRMSVCLSNH